MLRTEPTDRTMPPVIMTNVSPMPLTPTRRELREAVREIAACLGVYRTYVRRGSPPSEQDRRQVSIAVQEATRRRPDIDAELLSFVGDLLLMQHEGATESESSARFQHVM